MKNRKLLIAILLGVIATVVCVVAVAILKLLTYLLGEQIALITFAIIAFAYIFYSLD